VGIAIENRIAGEWILTADLPFPNQEDDDNE
jgi:hypothetical protein